MNVILSGAKNLDYFSTGSRAPSYTEMFRSAQHDRSDVCDVRSTRPCPKTTLLHSENPTAPHDRRHHGWVAQLAEQWTENPRVGGSIPPPAILQMKYDWKEAGEEWSQPWGSSAAQWAGTIFPRIRECLPAGTILEIAPGFGRWTHYLKDYCNELWAVDKSSDCIEACQERFASVSHVRCFLNDGRSLSMIPDASVDFVFSFDSFVHPDRDVVEAYLRQLGTKLKIGGKGFIHHSNFGEYVNSPRERLPEALAKPLIKAKILDWAHHRNPGMTAELFRALSARERPAMPESGAGELAWETVDRLPFAVRPQRFSA